MLIYFRAVTYSVTLVISSGLILLQSSPSIAGALAIGLDTRGELDFAYGSSAEGDDTYTRKKALNLCRGITEAGDNYRDEGPALKGKKLCKIVGMFHDQCAAVAYNNATIPIAATGVGWAIGENSDAAKEQALTMCRSMAKGKERSPCVVVSIRCDGAAK
jgi:Domain of unknown function (DUF4189)